MTAIAVQSTECSSNRSWIKRPLGEFAKARMGKTILAKELTEAGIAVYSAGRDTEPWGRITNSDLTFDSNTVVISARGNIGFAKVPRETPFVSTQTTIAVTIRERLLPTFLKYFFDTVRWNEMTSQTTIPMITVRQVEGIQVPIPSLDEQQRIVAEIEKQFTRLDAGVSSLKRVQAALKRHHASVLKAACEGRLVPTEAELARKENRSFETGEQLLQHILKERRDKWIGKGKYKEPMSANIVDLPQLSEGWTWSRLEQIGFVVGGLTKNPARAKLSKQFPYLRVANVYANELRLDSIETIGVKDSELEKLLLERDDLLIVEGNGSKDQIGRVAIWDGSINQCVHQNHVIKVRSVNARMARWILRWLLSPEGRHFVEIVASSTSGLYTLSVNKVGDLPVPIPPLSEQARILTEVERRLSVSEEVHAVAGASFKRAARLRGSILQQAFAVCS